MSDSIKMKRPWSPKQLKPIDGLEDASKRYVAGATIRELAAELGVKTSTLRNRFLNMGVELRVGFKVVFDIDDAARRYESGESLKSISDDIGVDRITIQRRFRERGIAIRGQSEAEAVKWSKMSDAARMHQTRGTHTEAAMVRRALTREFIDGHTSPVEIVVADALEAIGLNPRRQRPVGPYNIDLAFDELAVAVEVESGSSFSRTYRAKRTKRLEHLFNEGWAVLFFVHHIKPFDAAVVANKIRTFLDVARSDPSVHGKYGVIGRQGEPLTAKGYYFDQFARIPGF